MLKFKKILFSLLLCLVLLTGSVFATTMTESEIKDEFEDYHIQDNSTLSSTDLNTILDYLDENYTLSGNYIYYVYNSYGDNTLFYADLGDETLDSITVNPLTDDANVQFYFTGDVTKYQLMIMDNEVVAGPASSASNFNWLFAVDSNLDSVDFDNIFTYSGNDIFTESSSPSPSPSGIFAGILATMTYILASITTVMNSLVQVDLILFVILASLSISIIYFVIKLLKGFTGNKLVNSKKRK